MADEEPQRQLLLQIREFSAEKTKGERRISDLKKRLLELQTDNEVASAELEKAKWAREAAERELRASQAQLDRISASLLSLQIRTSGKQDEISQVSSELHAIMNDDEIQRDEFIRAMRELNSKIRKFNEMTFQALNKGHPDIPSDTDQGMDMQSENVIKDLENEFLSLDAEIHRLEGEYQEMVHDVNKISELEKTYSSLGEELHRKYICPKCQFNNMEASEWTPEAEEAPAN